MTLPLSGLVQQASPQRFMQPPRAYRRLLSKEGDALDGAGEWLQIFCCSSI